MRYIIKDIIIKFHNNNWQFNKLSKFDVHLETHIFFYIFIFNIWEKNFPIEKIILFKWFI